MLKAIKGDTHPDVGMCQSLAAANGGQDRPQVEDPSLMAFSFVRHEREQSCFRQTQSFAALVHRPSVHPFAFTRRNDFAATSSRTRGDDPENRLKGTVLASKLPSTLQ